MTPHTLTPTTMLEQLLQDDPLGLPGMIRVGGSDALLAVGIDNGNGHTKGAVFTADGALATSTIPTVSRTAAVNTHRPLQGAFATTSSTITDRRRWGLPPGRSATADDGCTTRRRGLG